jgi:hypothetical protein
VKIQTVMMRFSAMAERPVPVGSVNLVGLPVLPLWNVMRKMIDV